MLLLQNVQFFMHTNAVTDVVNEYKMTPLHSACRGEHKETAQYLVEKLKCNTGKFNDISYHYEFEYKQCYNKYITQ